MILLHLYTLTDVIKKDKRQPKVIKKENNLANW
jgi:hypothetical protein